MRQTAHVRRFMSKDLVHPDKGWKLSTIKKVCRRVDHMAQPLCVNKAVGDLPRHFHGWIVKTWKVKTMGTRGKINAIWWNIKRSLQKLLSSMWIRIANKFAKLQAKRLNRSAHITKVLGGYFFETPGSFKTRQTDSAIHVFCGDWVCNMLIFISFTGKKFKSYYCFRIYYGSCPVMKC